MAPWPGQGAICVPVDSKRQVAGPRGAGVCSPQGQTGRARMLGTPHRIRSMGSPRIVALVYCAFLTSWAGSPVYSRSAGRPSTKQQQPTAERQASSRVGQAGVPALPRAKKLVLKDGSFQMVRDYQRQGERVRYMSAERGDWEEIPAAMVDWEATSRAAAQEKSEQDALAKKIHAQEQAQKIETVMDVDASLQVAPGVFLPPGEGMFLIDGKSVKPLEQVGSEIKTDKKQFLKQVL